MDINYREKVWNHVLKFKENYKISQNLFNVNDLLPGEWRKPLVDYLKDILTLLSLKFIIEFWIY